jgi:DNA-directed RNA polymerase specialized sigma24 family protein
MNSAELDALLLHLDSDRQRAGSRYEELRTRLTRFFQWKGCREAEELADEVFDRAGRRLAAGEELRSGNPASFLQGIARLVHLEHLRKQGKSVPLPEEDVLSADPPEEPSWSQLALRACLAELGPEERSLILGYYDLESTVRPEDGETVLETVAEGAKGKRRRLLAERNGLTLNSLRIRAHRLRQRLEACVRSRLESGEGR